MSRIYFHSPEQTSEVSGAERYHMGHLCSEAFLTAGDLRARHKSERDYEWLKPLLPKGMREGQRFPEMLETWAVVGDMGTHGEDVVLIDGERHPLFNLQLNSAYVMGGDALKLAARLHGQCEIHCYVEFSNRMWLSDIIERALSDNIFREYLVRHEIGDEWQKPWPLGWRSVIDHLRDGCDSPVVCSYSVCDSFPDVSLLPDFPRVNAGEEDEEIDWDAWDKADQWGLCMPQLRLNNNSGQLLEIKPDDWQTFRFHGAKSGFDLLAQKYKTSESVPA
jgi:hypothetical protein